MASVGDTLKIEKIKGKNGQEIKAGDKLGFDRVLMVDNGTDTTIGAPYIKGAVVSAEVTKIARAKKVVVIKYKAKSNYYKKRGHRQPFFEVKITGLK